MLSKFMYSYTPQLPVFLNHPPEGQQFRTQTLHSSLANTYFQRYFARGGKQKEHYFLFRKQERSTEFK